ncbi:hypothetical protein ACFLXB_09995 [Chloroflexota bacterium]
MIKIGYKAVTLIFALLLVSCSGSNIKTATEAVDTQTPLAVMADTFFSGYAVLDENGNGIKDAGEPLLAGMTFSITLAGGGEFRGQTYEGQSAFITIPSALPEGSWPVKAGMIVPEGSLYELSGPTEINLERGQFIVNFLFTQK